MSKVNRKSYSAPALSKGLDILELMTAEPEGLSLRDIAEKLGRSKGEIFRMLVVLEERGYINLDKESDIYSLTLKIFKLAHQHSHVKRLSSVAEPVMRKLANAIKQSCHLVIYFNGNGIVIVQNDSPADRGFSVRLGATAPLPNTCSGHVLLAFSDNDKRKMMLNELPVKHKKQLTQSSLDAIVKKVRKQGYECIKSQQTHGVIDIGYPVFDYSGNIIAALVVPYLEHLDDSNQVDFDTSLSKLGQAASTISMKLGHK